jgi:quinol monooxygenase YgiN
MSEQNPPVAAVIIHEVEDFDKWLPLFNEHQAVRAEAGVLGHHLHRGADNPNIVVVYLPASDADKLTALLSNDELAAKMRESGVKGPPSIKICKPMSNEADLDKGLAAMIVMHKVKDYDAWRKGYDAFDAKRSELGITGHAVNQLIDDANHVIVYHQAEKIETLKEFMKSSDELKAAMKAAGVVSEPEVSFWNSTPGVMY